jgi:hypothetical protein
MENAKKSDAKAKISYRDSLDTITKARYVDKLKEIDGKDPYEMEKAEWSADMSEWPEVTYPDIVNYLVYTQSAYTLETNINMLPLGSTAIHNYPLFFC